jgi:DNA-binding FrmR family transcriptional regulator
MNMVIIMSVCKNCLKTKVRNEDEKKALTRRLKIIAGQINGIEQMINDDRYCDDILVQVASATNALKSFGNEMLRSHMKSCMIDEINKGNTEVVDEIINLIGKLK